MNKDVIQVLRETLQFPIYHLVYESLRTTVTKVDDRDGVLWPTKHVVTVQNQCSCLGWQKNRVCNHLQMVNNDYEGTGVSREVVLEELTRLDQLLGRGLFDKGNWTQYEHNVPEQVTKFEVNVPKGEKKYNPFTLVSRKTFPQGTLVLRLNFL